MASRRLKKLGLPLVLSLLFLVALFLTLPACDRAPAPAPSPTSLPEGEPLPSVSPSARDDVPPPYRITPNAMLFEGDVTRCSEPIAPPLIRSWCEAASADSIILGVNPTSPDPADWEGGSATTSLYIGEVASPTVAVISVAWPDRNGKGIHSPQAGNLATLRWDGVRIWTKRTRDLSDFGDTYAAQHSLILATALLTQPMTHTLAFSVPAHTAWDISRITIDLYPLGTTLRGIAYSPYRDCQNPHWGPFPTEAEVREDMERLAHMTNGIRTYSALSITGDIPRIAQDYGISVCAGAWLGRERDSEGRPVANSNRAEIDALIALAEATPLDCVIVGNEVLLRGDLSEEALIAYIREVKAAVDVPVTTAEISGLLRDHPTLIDALDFLMLHIYPSWDGQPIDGAVDYVVDEYLRWRSAYPDKRVVIGETGWPSAGPQRGAAVPGLENQRRFFYGFLDAAERHDIAYYYFDAFNELWKREEGVGGHWGYTYSDRTGKHEVQSVLLPGFLLSTGRAYLPLVLKGGRVSPLLAEVAPPGAGEVAVGEPVDTNPVSEVPAGELWVFRDYADEANRFAPSGWMGDLEDLRFYECERETVFRGEVAVRVSYDPQGPQGWAGIYWQEPANNWGNVVSAGYDLDEASALRFYARGEQGGEQVAFMMGGIRGAYPDSQQPALSTDIITLTDRWTEYAIDLRGRDLSHVVGGFAFVTDPCLNPEPVTFYLDDIRYVLDGDPGAPAPTPEPETPYAFTVYSDEDVAGNHYTPSGWTGDTGDVRLDACWRETTHTGSTAIRVAYAAGGQPPSVGCEGEPCGWAGVTWQEPADNWGDRPGGYDLSGAKHVTFWARGESGGEQVTFKIGGVGCEEGTYPDSLCPARTFYGAPIRLTDTWQPYTLSLPDDLDLGHVVGGFTWVASREDNPGGAVFYLDDIQYHFNVELPPEPHWVYVGSQLSEGYDMGVDTSGGLTGWVRDEDGALCMDYPPGQNWGAVFITAGTPVPSNRPGRDLSAYGSLSLELRGGTGGESVWVGLKDNTDPDNGRETKRRVAELSTDWQTVTFPLSSFVTADPSRLYVVTEFVFEAGTSAETVCFRNIRYLP